MSRYWRLEAFAQRTFTELPAGSQSVVLLMRALVGRPQLVLLDEVWLVQYGR